MTQPERPARRRRRREPQRERRLRLVPLATAVASLALVGVYLAAGGASYKPIEVADPCEPRPVEQLEERESALEGLALSALDGAACELRVTREELALAIATEESRERFLRTHRISEEELERAVRAGLRRAVADGRRTGELSGIEAELLAEAVERAPVSLILRALRSDTGEGLIEALIDSVRSDGVGLDDLRRFLP